MDIKTASLSLAALGHEARLDVFRALVRAGEDGMTVGEITAHLDIPPSTLAHHLRALVDAGLVQQSKRGRQTINQANFKTMNETVDFLTSQCCAGFANTTTDAA